MYMDAPSTVFLIVVSISMSASEWVKNTEKFQKPAFFSEISPIM